MKTIFLIIFFITASLLCKAQFWNEWFPTGDYNEPNARYEHPYTTFYRGENAEYTVEEQLENIRQVIQNEVLEYTDDVDKHGTFQSLYASIFAKANKSAVPSGARDSETDHSLIAKSKAFVALLGINSDGIPVKQQKIMVE